MVRLLWCRRGCYYVAKLLSVAAVVAILTTTTYKNTLVKAWSFRPNDVCLMSNPASKLCTTTPVVAALSKASRSRFCRWQLFASSKKDRGGNDDDGNVGPSKSDHDSDRNNSNDESIDWRDFRAKLVLQEKALLARAAVSPTINQSTTDNPIISTQSVEGSSGVIGSLNNNNNDDYDEIRCDSSILAAIDSSSSASASSSVSSSWAYESGDVIEVGSLIVSHPSQDFAYGGLRQQYFYKSVVLVIEHTPTFTKGVLLNRPTDQTMTDTTQHRSTTTTNKSNYDADDSDGDQQQDDWNVWFGGDVQGMDSDDEVWTCLHRLTSPLAKDLSVPILKDISSTSWEIAQIMVQDGDATKEDFWLCCGYAGWAAGQLQNELQRGNWFMAAFDVDSLWNMIGQELTNPQGTDMWVQVMKRIGKDSIINSPSGGQKFQDEMLKQWVRQKILKNPPQSRLRATQIKTTSRQQDSGSSLYPQQQQETTDSIRQDIFCFSPGTLIRASSPILLDEQVFHQSLVLILQNDIDTTVGVVLNRPSSTSVTIGGTQLPVRYGGRFGVKGQRQQQQQQQPHGDMAELWLHFNNEKLQDAKVGVPISPNNNNEDSTFWKCTRIDAETAVEIGLASPNDFMVVRGLSVWKKYRSLEWNTKQATPVQVELDTSFTVVDTDVVSSAWKLMNAQEPLNARNAVENLEAANAAWMLSTSRMFFPSNKGQGMQSQEQQKVQSLAYSALDKWIRTFLL